MTLKVQSHARFGSTYPAGAGSMLNCSAVPDAGDFFILSAARVLEARCLISK